MKKPTSKQWKQIMDSIKAKQSKAVKIPNELGEYMCDHFTNILPPICYGRDYVLSSEPYNHNDKGMGLYIGFFFKKNQWYGTISTTVDFTNML